MAFRGILDDSRSREWHNQRQRIQKTYDVY